MFLFPPFPALLATLAGALLSACATVPQPAAVMPPTAGPHLVLDVATPEGRRLGSAVALEGGLVVTAAHVLGPHPGRVSATDARGRRAELRVVARSTQMDLAVLAADTALGEPARLREGRPGAGEPVAAHGVTAAGIGRAAGAVIETGASLAGYGTGFVARLGAVQGYSGGPMLDAAGRVVGMTVALRANRIDLALAAARPARDRTQGGAGNEVFALGAAEIRAGLRALGVAD